MPAGGGGMGSWGLAMGKKTTTCGGGRTPGIPVDMYGHSPTEVSQYKSWTGCLFSVVVIIVVAVSCGYVLFEYFTEPYDLASSQVVYDPEVMVEPEGEILTPDIGVQFSSLNNTVLDILAYPEVVDILFFQRFQYGDGAGGECPGKYDGARCKKSSRIPGEPCRFHGPVGVVQKFEAFCPRWGYLVEKVENDILSLDFEATDTRENATVPRFQGNNLDDVYAYVDVQVRVNFTGLELLGRELQLSVADFYGGSITYILAYNRYEVFDVGINDRVQEKFERFTKTVRVKEFLSSTVDVPLVVRSIGKGNFIVDFAFLEGEYSDVVVGEVTQELNDAAYISSIYRLQNSTDTLPTIFDIETQKDVNTPVPETLMMSRAHFHISTVAHQIQMTPPSTIFDILGTVGGFLSLFSLLIGWPAMIINQMYYDKALKKAIASGDIPEDYLDEDGTVKVDKANEVVQVIKGLEEKKKITKRQNGEPSSKE